MTTSMRRLSVVTGAVALFLIVVWYLALFHPQGHKLTAAHQDKATADAKIQTLNQQIGQLNLLKKEIPADTAKLGTYQQAVPDNPQLPAALQAIQQAASNTGVVLSNLNPSAAAKTGSGGSAPSGTPQIPVSMNVSGTYSQVTAFITALTSMPRTLVIQSVNMSQSGNSMTASISSDVYYAGQPTP